VLVTRPGRLDPVAPLEVGDGSSRPGTEESGEIRVGAELEGVKSTLKVADGLAPATGAEGE
jgi:hypothetical protein